MKFVFRAFLSLIVFFYTSTGGRIGGKTNGGDVLLLTTTGRKSGKKRTVPLIYIMDGPAYVITASAGGGDKNPGWFFNIRSNPRATIQVKDKRLDVAGEVAGSEKRAELWARLTAALPFYGDYQKRTKREIPMVILRPVSEPA
ncbi:MAG TPA: nitroreductase family deazaflavin-dependent oxidoreductase [Ktedonobacteraceae bacterium]|nr:nitroreductase family deazaflavin-dependent oxidoreductase [Ktedonobacteraceae bacterium]